MPMSVTYATVHGRLVEENRGGVVTEYVPDTLGNVIMTTNESGTVTSTTTYWPFGEVRTQTGTNPSSWGFCGVWGYLTDAVSRMYVRARHYRADTSRWLAVDPLWPRQSAFSYVLGRPVDLVDPSGKLPQLGPALIAGLAACLASAGASWIGSILGGDSPRVAWCKAGIKCFVDALRAALLVLFPALVGVVNCLMATIAALLKLAADKLCPCMDDKCCDLTLNWCDGIKAAADAAIGCVGAIGADEFRETFGEWWGNLLTSGINGLTRGAAKIACEGAVDFVRS